MKILKKILFALLFALTAAGFFAQGKSRLYYIERYQNSYMAEDNVKLLYYDEDELKGAIEKKYIDVNYKYEEGRTLILQALRTYNYEPDTFIRIAEFLIENGADVNIADNNGNTPLLYAVKYCYISQKLDTRNIDFLLKNNADPKVQNKDGETIMYELCGEKKPEMDLIKRFIKLGAPINVASKYSFSPLTYALYHKNLDLAKLLIQSGADVDIKDESNHYPLSMACDAGDLELVKLMLSKGADVNVKNNEKYTPLHYAVRSGPNNLKLVRLLVEKGADVNAATESGYTPLIFAGREDNNLELIKYLVDKKADVNAHDNEGYNVGMACATEINLECLKFLDENGFDFKARTKNGETILHWFIKMVTCSWEESILYYQFIMEEEKEIGDIIDFLAGKIDINSVDDSKETALHYAARSLLDYTPIIKFLIKNGANVNAVNNYGKTPIFYTCATPEIVQLLVDSGAKLSIKDKFGKTFLDYSEEAIKDNPNMSKIVEILKTNSKDKKKYTFVQLCEYNYADKAFEMLKKEKVENLDKADTNGYTPLYYAVINKNIELTKALLDKGCNINKRNGKEEITVLYYAVNNQEEEMVKLLLNYKPDLTLMYKHYGDNVDILYTSIHSQKYYDTYNTKKACEIIKCLLEAGCNPNLVIEKDRGTNYTITVDCIMCGLESFAELLIEYGGNPFAVWTSYIYQYQTSMSFSIIRKNLSGDMIDYEEKNAVYQGLQKYYEGKILAATDNLRIRDGYGLSDRTITAIKKGTKVKVLDAYNMEIIDGIHSCWVKVEVLPDSVDSQNRKIASGTTGWCFLGYLEELK